MQIKYAPKSHTHTHTRTWHSTAMSPPAVRALRRDSEVIAHSGTTTDVARCVLVNYTPRFFAAPVRRCNFTKNTHRATSAVAVSLCAMTSLLSRRSALAAEGDVAFVCV